jgi:hydrogenase maturation protein HypF
VGFRPWVWQQAASLGLIGWVRNTHFGVEIDVHGDAALIDTLQARLWQAPAPARVEAVDVLPLHAPDEEAPPSTFDIRASDTSEAGPATTIGTDLGLCTRCLGELFDPANRRWRHAFINCPQCGPRYTLTRQLPFDRAHTSMARFVQCAECEREYQDGWHRRFHHQTNNCPACGPHLWLTGPDGHRDTEAPLAAALKLLREGQILAVKGLGGFHLICDARQPAAVARLRQRKQRDTKPLAIMVANAESVAPWATLNDASSRWLQAVERPIVLLPQTAHSIEAMPGVAPGLAWLGVMLPYTPIHYLLFHEAAGRPEGTHWLSTPQDMVLVVTSGNASGAPLVTDNDTALLELADIADAWLMHDRDILARNDDSVLRVRPDGSACFLRRSRGYAPNATSLGDWPVRPGQAEAAPSILALGGLLKSTLCITQGDRALVSPHIGDLDAVETRVAFTRLADTWPGWLRTQADWIACDLHPDFFSTTLAAHMAQTHAASRGSASTMPLVQVQHHHAHVAAVIAEHAEDKHAHLPVIGLALDGHGLGLDGTVWGGELLRVAGADLSRLGHLWPMPMPGGDAAAREPWRMAASALHCIGLTEEISRRFPNVQQAPLLQQWLAQDAGRHAMTSSLGRLFDAVAGLTAALGAATQSRYEAEAAMRLESLAWRHGPMPPRPDGWLITDQGVLDWRPLMRWLVTQRDPGVMAATFHATMAAALAEWASRACRAQGIDTVVLSGGCLANRLLDDALYDTLRAQGLRVWRPRHYPCGDGALSLGQAWVVRQQQVRHTAALG